MTWMLRPKLPTGETFDGQIVFNSTDMEIDDFSAYVDSVGVEIGQQFEIKNTGFEKKKYRKTDASLVSINIMLVGNLPFWLHEILHRVAIAINGAGMIVQFRDTFVTGTSDTPVTYNCRWVNAGDFVSNSELLHGGSIELVAYTLPEDEGSGPPSGGVYEKVINTPASGYEWDLKVNDADATYIHYRII